ncbi:MAG: hypothetical protein ACFB22_09825 [Rhodothalassiaceae bacterium]
MASITQSDSPAPKLRRQGAREFRLILILAFLVFLTGLVLTWPVRRFFARDSGPRPSVFRAAWEKANASVPFVFMS